LRLPWQGLQAMVFHLLIGHAFGAFHAWWASGSWGLIGSIFADRLFEPLPYPLKFRPLFYLLCDHRHKDFVLFYRRNKEPETEGQPPRRENLEKASMQGKQTKTRRFVGFSRESLKRI
jgi:hypothetical protein